MQELGDLLREARLAKGMSLEEIENLTKIRKRYLEAIEEGQYKVLPGSFYVRAFVKSYAEAVGLDPAQVLRMYRNVIPDPGTATKTDAYPVKRRRRNANTDKWSKIASTLVLICFLAVIAFVIYRYYVLQAEPRGDIDENIPITQKTDYSERDPARESGASVNPTPPPETKPEPPAPPTPDPVLAKIGTEGNADVYVLKHADKLFIRMESLDANCWYDVYKDGYYVSQVETGTLKAGDSRDYEFTTAGHFHMGFAKTIKLTVNGIEFKPSEHPGGYHVIIQLEQGESADA